MSTLPAFGVHAVPFSVYQSWRAVNWHTLEPFRTSAKHGRHAMLTPEEASRSQVLGEAFHAAVLEPERFAREYIAMPVFEGHPASKAYRDAKAAWQQEHKHMVHLTAAEWDEVRAMGEAARAHRILGPLLAAQGRNELSILWREPETGTVCKSRIDRLCRAPYGLVAPGSPQANENVIYLIDAKSTRNIEPRAFSRDVAAYGYHGQIASYDLAVQAVSPSPLVVLIAAIENHPPYDVAVYRLGDDELRTGRNLFYRLLRMKLQCEQDGVWPGIGEDVVLPLRLPSYAMESDDVA